MRCKFINLHQPWIFVFFSSLDLSTKSLSLGDFSSLAFPPSNVQVCSSESIWVWSPSIIFYLDMTSSSTSYSGLWCFSVLTPNSSYNSVFFLFGTFSCPETFWYGSFISSHNAFIIWFFKSSILNIALLSSIIWSMPICHRVFRFHL